MKVLFLTMMFPCQRNPTSGIFLANPLRALKPLVDDLLVICARPYLPRWLAVRRRWRLHAVDPSHDTWQGVEVLRPRVPLMPGTHHAWWAYHAALPWLRRLVRQVQRERQFDWLVGYDVTYPGLWTAALAGEVPRRAAWAIGVDIHTMPQRSPRMRAAAAWAMRNVDLVICVSDAIRDAALAIEPGIRRAVTFYRGVETDAFKGTADRAAVRAELGLAPDRKYLIFIGRLTYEKGLSELMTCYERVAVRHPDWDLILIGASGPEVGFSGAAAARLPDWIRRHSFERRVIRTGLIEHDRVVRYLRGADLFVLPTYAEGLSNAVLEAGAAGLPIVCSDAGGNREFVGTGGEAGLLVPVRDAEAFAAAVERMIADPALREQCGAEGRRRAREGFDMWRNASVLKTILEAPVGQ